MPCTLETNHTARHSQSLELAVLIWSDYDAERVGIHVSVCICAQLKTIIYTLRTIDIIILASALQSESNMNEHTHTLQHGTRIQT